MLQGAANIKPSDSVACRTQKRPATVSITEDVGRLHAACPSPQLVLRADWNFCSFSWKHFYDALRDHAWRSVLCFSTLLNHHTNHTASCPESDQEVSCQPFISHFLLVSGLKLTSHQCQPLTGKWDFYINCHHTSAQFQRHKNCSDKHFPS